LSSIVLMPEILRNWAAITTRPLMPVSARPAAKLNQIDNHLIVVPADCDQAIHQHRTHQIRIRIHFENIGLAVIGTRRSTRPKSRSPTSL
jgi:hypothetical protein